MGRDLNKQAQAVKGGLFQSTRPHGARPSTLDPATPRAMVSIHAPAWGATTAGPGRRHRGSRFNPRARMGRDEEGAGWVGCRKCFNPRARMGRDNAGTRTAIMSGVDPFQSTRPHGARRSSRCPGRGHHWRFNPRARMGRDRDGQPVMRSKLVFQSTRPHGARQQTGPADQGRRWRFNPRARMGRDAPAPVMADGQPQVSIHAPAWGATQ